MKQKIILAVSVILLAATFYSFKNIGESESSNFAIVLTMNGKGEENDGYLIMYGDGTTETVPFKIKVGSSENALLNAAMAVKMMNTLHDKGYRYVGNSATANSMPSIAYQFMIFEKTN